MRNFWLIITLIFSLGACNSAPNTSTTQKSTAISVNPADLATWKDLSCNMSMKNSPITDTAMVNGKIYPFCAKECKANFLKNKSKLITVMPQ